MSAMTVPFPKPAALPVPAEDVLAYFTAELPHARRLRCLTAIDLMYGYYCEE